MRYFGLHLGHDAGLAAFNEKGDLIFYAQTERLEQRIKTHRLSVEPILKNFQININKKDILVITNSKEGKTFKHPEYDETLISFPSKNFAQEKIKNNIIQPNLVIDHHLAHAIASWCFRKNDEEKFFLAYDGAGATANSSLNFKNYLIGSISKDNFYKIETPYDIPSSIPLSSLLGYNSAGKVMGLAGYFKEIEPLLPSKEDVVNLLYKSFNWSILQSRPPVFVDPSEEDLRFVARFYKMYTECIWEKLKINIEKFANGRNLIIGGGTALALDINTKIKKTTKELTFGPPINDSGLALGAATFAYFHIQKKWPKPFKNADIHSLNMPLPEIGPQDPTDIAKLIADDKVVGLLRGKAECGPRALGFRSILANACKYKNLKRVSEDLKGREYFRPLAPIVTEESFDRYFVGPQGEYMQYKCECTEEAQAELPAIVHKDNSSRPQVVIREKDPWLHALLVEYGRLTGHECMINTSLNGKGKPICNTYQDAVDDFQGKDIELISTKTQKSILEFNKIF